MAEMPKDGDSETMTDKDETAAPATPAPRRGPGHRAADARDTAAEMAARAHEISLEAGSRMSGAMREVIGAAAGLSEFAIESARDLINYMVRRGQMTRVEGDALIHDAEQAYIAKYGELPKLEPKPSPPKPVPLGQLPKAVTAPAKAAEAALEARAALRAQDLRPSTQTFVEVAPKPLGKAAPIRDVGLEPPASGRKSRKGAKADEKTAVAPAREASKSAKAAGKAVGKAAGKGGKVSTPAEPAKAKPVKASAAKAPRKAAPASSRTTAKAATKTAAKGATKVAGKATATKSASGGAAKGASKGSTKAARTAAKSTAKPAAKSAAKAVKSASKGGSKPARPGAGTSSGVAAKGAKASSKTSSKAAAKASTRASKAAKTAKAPAKKAGGKKR